MLKSLEFENFKSWGGRHRLEFGRITGLFGANSSGKSSIIHLLLLLKQTTELRDPSRVLNFGDGTNDYVDLGSFVDVVTNHDTSQSISFSVSWNPDRPISVGKINASSSLSAIAGDRGESVVISHLGYEIHFTDSVTRISRRKPRVLSIDMKRLNQDYYAQHSSLDNGDSSERDVLQGNIRLFGLGGLDVVHPHGVQIDYYRDDMQNKQSSTKIESEVAFHIEMLFRQVVYLGPLRNHPRRSYTWTGVTPSTAGHRGEQAMQVLLTEKLATLDVVTRWLRHLGMAESLSLERVGSGARIWESLIRHQTGGAEVNLADVGFGVSQVLPVIVTLLSAPPGSLVILEHPDIHLHPKAQSELADLLIDIASAGEIQILLESHSEHLLARIQRRIAESARGDGGLAPEDVRLYFCEQEQGKSKLTPLKMQPSGLITNWPRDFFGDMLAERMALSGFYPRSDDRTADG